MTEQQELQKPAKPMTRDERRALEKIVKSDHETLRAEIAAQASEALSREKADIEERFRDKEKELPEITREVRETVEQARRLLEDKLAEIRNRGFVINQNYSAVLRVEMPMAFKPEGKDEALAQAQSQVVRAKNRALANVTRSENDAIRKVTLTAVVSDQASSILDSFPSATQLITNALAEAKAPSLEIEGEQQ